MKSPALNRFLFHRGVGKSYPWTYLDNDPAPYLPSIIQRVSLSREESRETGRDSGEFGKLCSRHRYPAQRDVLSWHWDTRYGAPWVFVVNILYTHTPPGSRRGRRVLCRGGRGGERGRGSSKKRGRGREERVRGSSVSSSHNTPLCTQEAHKRSPYLCFASWR